MKDPLLAAAKKEVHKRRDTLEPWLDRSENVARAHQRGVWTYPRLARRRSTSVREAQFTTCASRTEEADSRVEFRWRRGASGGRSYATSGIRSRNFAAVVYPMTIDVFG